jgi:hypothetical protein
MESNISKSAMVNGLIIGFLLSLKFILSIPKNNFFTFITLFISILIIVLMYKMTLKFRETEFGGVIKYGQAFKHVFLLYLYGTIISTLIILVYTKYINTTYLDEALSSILKIYDSFKIPVDDKTGKALESVFKPIPYSFGNLFGSLFIAAFWGLILAAFLKKEKNIFQ